MMVIVRDLMVNVGIMINFIVMMDHVDGLIIHVAADYDCLDQT